MTIVQKKARSFREYVDCIENIRTTLGGSTWYRGVKDRSYWLQPTLYRHPDITNIIELLRLEHELINTFRHRSIPYRTRSLDEDWEALFFMQHYGVPTRLLDWTENPFMGLFFAVMSVNCERSSTGRISFKKETAVWVLDPVAWNRHALGSQSFSGGILSTEESELAPYAPGLESDLMNDLPIAIYGAYNSQRIVAQRGAFTVFGTRTHPMEQLHQAQRFPATCLQKIVITKSGLHEMRKTMMEYGITDSVVFPDLTGLARELKRHYKFEV